MDTGWCSQGTAAHVLRAGLVPSFVLAEAILTFPRLVVNMQTLFKSMVTLVKVCIVWLHLMTMDNIKLY